MGAGVGWDEGMGLTTGAGVLLTGAGVVGCMVGDGDGRGAPVGEGEGVGICTRGVGVGTAPTSVFFDTEYAPTITAIRTIVRTPITLKMFT